MKKINVLSLFNGMSFGAMALETCGIEVDNYYSSEIDKYANQATKALYPDIIQLGDVTKWREWDIDWSSIDLLLAGFPCQAWSMAGKQEGDNDPRGALVHDLIDIWIHINKRKIKNCEPPVKFMFENVKMKKEFLDYINELFGVDPVCINSSLLSAQNRVRYYWTNISKVDQPDDKRVTWGDVREHGVEFKPMYYSDKAMDWIGRHGSKNGKKLKVHNDLEKMQMLEASHYKKYSSQRFFGIVDTPSSIVGRRLNDKGVRDDYNKSVPITQCLQVKHNPSKTGCLTTVIKDNVISCLPHGRYPDVFNQLEEGKHYRYITPTECFRLQTVPERHINTLLSAGISNTQLYKMLGNGWTHDVIVHIFKGLKINSSDL